MAETADDPINSDIEKLYGFLSEAREGYNRNENVENAKALLKTFRKSLEHRNSICKFRNKADATVLDMAIRCRDVELTSSVLDMCPELVTSKQVKGQTVLRLALLSFAYNEANVKLYEKILACAGVKRNDLLSSHVTGNDTKTDSNVTAIQLPLFIAAMQLEENVVEMLLKYGASLFVRNKRGDTVFHSLIRYISTKRELIPDAVRMVKFLHHKVVESENQNPNEGDNENPVSQEEKQLNLKHIWFVRNQEEKKTALQLAAMYGLKPLVEAILLLKDVYYSHSDDDGTYDEKIYDVTEIDSLACKSEILNSASILEMIFENDRNGSDLTDIFEIKPIRRLIDLKWKYYRKFYALWVLVHFPFTFLYSIYAVEHSNTHYDKSGTQLQKGFVMVFQWIALLFGFVFLVVGIAAILPRVFKLFQRWPLFRTHNTDHVLIYIMFAVSVIVESILNIADVQYSGLVMIMAVTSCWWFNIFFFGMNKTLTFVAVLFREIIVRDFFRICIFIGSQLLMFTAVMHMLYQGVGIPAVNGQEYDPDPENAPTYQMSLFAMLNLMLGLGGIESMDKSRFYVFAVMVYVTFVLLTHIIFFNALIATTSSTCAEIAIDEERRFVLNRLSMILYMEDILTIFLKWLDPLHKMGVRKDAGFEVYYPIAVEEDKNLKTKESQDKKKSEKVFPQNAKSVGIRYFLDMRTTSNIKAVKNTKESQDKKISEKMSPQNAKSVDYISEVLIKSLKIMKTSSQFPIQSNPSNYAPVPIKEYVPEKTIEITVTRPFESIEEDVDAESTPINQQ